MSIKSQGGVFGRNPTFATLTVENGISVGSLTVGGETITGLSYQGAWNANTNTPDITASPAQGQFWIVSVDGSTNVGGITNWTTGDWALYDGSNWQRVEGGNTDLSSGVTGQLAVTNGGTGASDAATARTNLGLGSAATTASTDYATAAQGSLADSALQPSDIGSTVQGYDADTAKYDDTTANFTGTLQNGGSNVLVDTDIGSTVQAYDADTAKLDTAQTWTAAQSFGSVSADNLVVENSNGELLRIASIADSGTQQEFGIGFATNVNHTYPAAQILAKEYDASDSRAGLNFYTRPNNSDTASIRRLNIHTNGDIVFYEDTGSTAKMTWDASAGNLAFASGQGIDFSATSGTGTSELLDDYEEGLITVTSMTPETSGTITVGANNTLSYIKIGNLVHVSGGLYNFTASSPVGNYVLISGLPFVSANLTDLAGIAIGFTQVTSTSSGDVFTQTTVGEGSSDMYVYFDASTIVSGVTDIKIALTYRAA